MHLNGKYFTGKLKVIRKVLIVINMVDDTAVVLRQ